MPHVVFRGENDVVEGVLCIERLTGTAYILSASETRLEELAQQAKANNVPELRMVAHKDEIEELAATGWKVLADLVVLTKE